MRNVRRALFAILALAAASRVAAALFVGDAHVPWSHEVEVIAQQLVTTGSYSYTFYGLSPPAPTSFQPPVYPLILAGTRILDPSGAGLLQVVQILASTASIWLLYRLSLSIGLGERVGLLAALGMACYPPLIGYSVLTSPVTIETLLLLASLVLTLEARSDQGWKAALGAGVLLGLLSLTRSPWLLVLPLAMIWLALQNHGSRWKGLLPAAVLGGAALLTLLPWGIWNLRTQGAITFTGTNGGLNFWIGNNPKATGEYQFPTSFDADLVKRTADWPEIERDRFFYRQGFAFIKAQPKRWLDLVIKKLQYFLLFRPSMGSTYQQSGLPIDLARTLYTWAWLFVLPFGVLGLVLDGRHRSVYAFLIAVFISQAVVAGLYFAGTRFRTPLEPIFILGSAIALMAIFDAARARLQPANVDA